MKPCVGRFRRMFYSVIINPVSTHKTASDARPSPRRSSTEFATSSPIALRALPRIRAAVRAVTSSCYWKTIHSTVMSYRLFLVYEFRLKSSGFLNTATCPTCHISARIVNKMQNISNENCIYRIIRKN